MNNLIKVIKALVDALMTLILIFGIAFIVLYVVGIEPYIVISGSMEPAVKKGSLSFINNHSKFSDVKENDVIAYTASTGAKVTHRAIRITEEGIETKGDRNSSSDGITTTEENFIGKNVFSIPQLGYLIKNLQTARGKLILITLVMVILASGFLMDDKKDKKVKECEEINAN